MQPADFGTRLDAELGIQIGERLIQKKHLGIADQRPSEGHPLTLAARECFGLAAQVLAKAEHVGGVVHLALDLCFRRVSQREREGHIVVDVHVGIEGVVLKHHGDVAVFGSDMVDPVSPNVQVALGNLLQPGNHTQRRALAAARRPHEHEKLVVKDLQIQVANDVGVVAISLGHMVKSHVCHRLLLSSTR